MQIQFLVKLDCTQISEITEVKNNWQSLKVQQTGAEERVESRDEGDEGASLSDWIWCQENAACLLLGNKLLHLAKTHAYASC